jgi:membrane-associated phospholipid phosphatase
VLLLDKKFRETAALGTMFAECWLFTLGAVNMTKAAAGRKRPYVYNTKLSMDQRYGMTSSDDDADVYFSFISGHAASAFCMAAFTSKVFTDIYGKSIWSHLVWSTSLSFASVAAYSRVKAGRPLPDRCNRRRFCRRQYRLFYSCFTQEIKPAGKAFIGP